MAEVINMPRLSDTMEEGTVAKWLKKVGDTVEEGDILAEIETDKATMEFESFYSGVLLHIGIQEGESAQVDKLLAIIGEEGEDIQSLIEAETIKTDSADTSSSKEETNDSSDETDDTGSNADIPEGVTVVTMPRLSDTMVEGTVAKWLKKEGDSVEEGDILAEIETDKATMEFESFYSGTLLKIGINEGESAKVDALLAIIGPKGADVSSIDLSKKPVKKTENKKTSAKAESPKKDESATENKPAAETSATISSGERIFASPLAKKLAEEKGINLNQVKGSGENGRIVKRDIENYTPHSAGTQTSFVAAQEEAWESFTNSQMRKTIAKRLAESKFTAPHYYLMIEIDMDNAIAARSAVNSQSDSKISYNDMVIKAAAMALRKHPKVNAKWTDQSIERAQHIHIGVAVAVEDGLLVPVLKYADQMTYAQINAEVKSLAEKSRTKKIQPQEMEGSTFTISNLGMFGITEFTSIINQPNSCIMSVGTIVQKPVVKNGEIVIGNTMKISMACDHRVVDGATGAAYLQTFKQYMENPILMYV